MITPPSFVNEEIMQKLKVAIIGTGSIADYHAHGLQTLANVEIAIAVDTQQAPGYSAPKDTVVFFPLF